MKREETVQWIIDVGVAILVLAVVVATVAIVCRTSDVMASKFYKIAIFRTYEESILLKDCKPMFGVSNKDREAKGGTILCKDAIVIFEEQ